jgi:hypothetical protein
VQRKRISGGSSVRVVPAQTWWIWVGVQYVASHSWMEATPGSACVGTGATAKVCGVAVGDAAGVQLGASLADRYVVNVGTVDVRPPTQASGRGGGQVRCRLLGIDGTEAP